MTRCYWIRGWGELVIIFPLANVWNGVGVSELRSRLVGIQGLPGMEWRMDRGRTSFSNVLTVWMSCLSLYWGLMTEHVRGSAGQELHHPMEELYLLLAKGVKTGIIAEAM